MEDRNRRSMNDEIRRHNLAAYDMVGPGTKSSMSLLDDYNSCHVVDNVVCLRCACVNNHCGHRHGIP